MGDDAKPATPKGKVQPKGVKDRHPQGGKKSDKPFAAGKAPKKG